jgi:hypothetical protein
MEVGVRPVSSDRIDHRGLLADEHMACAMKHQGSSAAQASFVGTNRILTLLTASQIASASAMSFFCRLT